MSFTIPNCLTFFRILVIPIIVVFYFSDIQYKHFYITLFFILAAISDGLDGYLARRWNQTSKLGAFLDPVADKLLVAVTLVLVVSDSDITSTRQWPVLFIVTIILIISREITVSALREWMAELGKRANVAVSSIGKVKTSVQMTAIGFLLFKSSLFGLPVLFIGELLLYIAGILTIWSMSVYLSAAFKALKNEL